MGETLKVGDPFENWLPTKQRQADGTYDYVTDPAGGLLSVPQNVTVIEIIPRPEDEKEAALIVKDLMDKISRNQNVVDGRLYRADNQKIGHLFDPNSLYVVES